MLSVPHAFYFQLGTAIRHLAHSSFNQHRGSYFIGPQNGVLRRQHLHLGHAVIYLYRITCIWIKPEYPWLRCLRWNEGKNKVSSKLEALSIWLWDNADIYIVFCNIYNLMMFYFCHKVSKFYPEFHQKCRLKQFSVVG